MSHEFVIDQLPEYALGILPADEAEKIARHIETCAACRRELANFEAITGDLALAIPAIEPTAGLEARLMNAVARTPQIAPSSPKRNLWNVLADLFARPIPAWQAAAFAAVLIVALFGFRSLRQTAPATPATMQTIAMLGTDAAPAASGLIVVDSGGDKGTLIVEDLPPLDAAHQYQLWLIKDGQRISGAIFSVDDVGYGTTEVQSPRPLAEFAAFGITIEPAGGSPGPTGAKVLGGSSS